MTLINCQIEETEIENDEGIEVDSIIATCSACGHQTESYGTSRASIKRCLVLMREECPHHKHAYYIEGKR